LVDLKIALDNSPIEVRVFAIFDRATAGEVLGHGRDGVRPDLLALEGFNVCNE
jgi:hypothetical protein